MLKQLIKKTFFYDFYVTCRNKSNKKTEKKIQDYFQKKGINDIFFLQEKLTSIGLPFFFDFGTLLGLYRDGGIIKGDMDIDIGVLVDEKNSVSEIQRKLSCFKKIRSFVAEESGVAEESYELNKYVRFDIHFYYKESNKRFCCLFYRLPQDVLEDGYFNTVKVLLNNFSIGTFKLNGREISVPLAIEDFLIQKYGKSWRVPDSKWNYWEGPCSVKVAEKGHIDLFIK